MAEAVQRSMNDESANSITRLGKLKAAVLAAFVAMWSRV
jgi:hypothetical protein